MSIGGDDMSGRLLRSYRMVPDPSMTDSEFYHQQARELERVSRSGAKPNPNVGKVHVLENAMTRIGALCYIKEKSELQEKAAELFKATYESLYGAQPGIDMSNPIVDRTIIAHDAGMASRVDRADKMRKALDMLGRTAFNRVVASVCMGISFRHLHWRKRKEEVQALLDSLDAIAVIWKLGRKSDGA